MGVQSVWGPCQSLSGKSLILSGNSRSWQTAGAKKVWAEEDGRGLGNSRSEDGKALM